MGVKKLGYEEIDCVVIDIDLSEEEIRAHRLEVKKVLRLTLRTEHKVLMEYPDLRE